MKTTVQKAYMGSNRVLADSNGRVFVFKQGWVSPAEPVTLVAGAPYERWTDVPMAWCGYVPFFPINRRST